MRASARKKWKIQKESPMCQKCSGVIQALAPLLMVEVSHVNEGDASEIERAIRSFAGFSNGGLIITASGVAYIHLNQIVKLAAQHRLPAVYFERAFVAAGGLMSHGPDLADQFRRAASYVDRVLKGEKPADLPVQAPTKYEHVINNKTAKTHGNEVPPKLLARADGLIERREESFKMKLPRRKFLHLAAGAAVLPVVSRVARAQTYPTRPVRIMVGFPPAARPTSSRA
jgi:hypothetical protein